ncbi:Hypothetical protein HEAR2725 [Herminiimonas arsenicoxydans]|uniref:Uncharacterized protein n=1 Tax=Herminiimonas arsenicoxydans TaxID=204773 RepID=A4G8K8_HERAR|nr:Hypothetical protein HEAR2725 [Herminiimonas arsenicoxydans]
MTRILSLLPTKKRAVADCNFVVLKQGVPIKNLTTAIPNNTFRILNTIYILKKMSIIRAYKMIGILNNRPAPYSQ